MEFDRAVDPIDPTAKFTYEWQVVRAHIVATTVAVKATTVVGWARSLGGCLRDLGWLP